jgi:hypothetical protein
MVKYILLLSFFFVGFSALSQMPKEVELAVAFDDSQNGISPTHNDGREKWKKVEVPNKRTLVLQDKHRKTHRPMKF